ncbi:AfsR/SARP family transcriptional regulator [Streptomyces marincola]|uniref:AfsR/SARP family transcriptional regulator n=1 Tax=Streptomyces marincola TaxID=2878388 RepID=UPI001CF522E8|nr:BTAD domain-containing putative transcriptional regulator [Streptomyces marincola]UCM88135.1 winged helix-turn-helix domain-containing protein [Streptomyces marincola]
MAFRVLGPVELLSSEGMELPLSGRLRDTAALLTVRPNTFVATETLADGLWGGSPPRGAATTVRTYIHGLRKTFDRYAPGQVIETRAGGYLLPVTPEALDASRLRDLLRRGLRARGDGRLRMAESLLDEAVSLWRGRPYTGVAPDVLLHETTAELECHYRAAVLARAAIRLASGRAADAVTDLRGLAVSFPTDEQVAEELIRALRSDGRDPEAAEAYRTFAARLAAEHGAVPARGLRSAALDGAHFSAPTSSAAPPPVTPLIGRDGALRRVLDSTSARAEGREHRVTVICGPPGIGKSALALHAAHRRGAWSGANGGTVAYVDLHQCTSPGEAWQRVDGLGERPDLLLLDGVRDPEVGRAALAAGSARTVLVTSRRPLAALRAHSLVRLSGLGRSSAIRFLRDCVGAERVDAEPEAAEAIAVACDGHPLALHIAAVKLALCPTRPLSRLAGRLADPRHLLNELQVDGLAMRPLAEAAIARCTKSQRLWLRRLARHGRHRLTAADAAGLAAVTVAEAEAALDGLTEHGLLCADPGGGGGYRVSSLVRAALTEPRRGPQPAK